VIDNAQLTKVTYKLSDISFIAQERGLFDGSYA